MADMIVLGIAIALYSLLLVGGFGILSSRIKKLEGAFNNNQQSLSAGTQPQPQSPDATPRDERSVAAKIAYFPDPDKADTMGYQFLFVVVKGYGVSSERRDDETIEKCSKEVKDLLNLIHNLIEYHLSCRIWHRDSPMEAIGSLKDRLKDSHVQVVSTEVL